ncbi:hypothetical protein CMI46_02420 [Candidatus Pacearchaeota archaeon]|nr:hypothetical protein [Candidatus Pacearchaeota archaeon]|tara:strand:- start:764 stop:1021 length:258 start_codon:yes stop_codon:yes gene_type:complete
MTYYIIRLTEEDNPEDFADYYTGNGEEIFGGISPTPYFGARWRAPKFNSISQANIEKQNIEKAMQEGITPQRELQVINTNKIQTK